MTTYVHGKGAALLQGAYDLSPWVDSATISATTMTADTSHFGSNAKTYIVGQNDATMNFAGLYDGTVGAIEPVQAAIYNAQTTPPFTLAPEGYGVGKSAQIGLCKQTDYAIQAQVSDVVKVTGSTQISGGAHFGNMLNDATVATATNNGTAVDNGAATTLGGFAHIHVLSNTLSGTFAAKIQHSTDSSTWVDHTAFTVVSAGLTASEEIVLAGTINRYTRLVETIGGTGNVVALAAIARN